MSEKEKILVFAGTTEGFEISRFLARRGMQVYACTATEYGGKSLEGEEGLQVFSERMNENRMLAVLGELSPSLVLDATHPYAAQVTENIIASCAQTDIPYQRLLRESDLAGRKKDSASNRATTAESGLAQGGIIYVEDTAAAIRFLSETEGNILLTTGSKELSSYTALGRYQERLYARVLSLPSVMDTCRSLGLEGRHLIGMQGPFSRELNAAMLRQYDCRYLVTKDTGKAGGFEEKLLAAEDCAAKVVVIGRPPQVEGLSLKECKRMLSDRFHLPHTPHITLLGIGMGSTGTVTVEGQAAARKADLVIGAKRMTDALETEADRYAEYRAKEIRDYILDHPEYDNIVIALSGDVGFYSGAKGLLQVLTPVFGQVEVLCGISSVNYFMAKIGQSWDDACIVSAHGRACNLPFLICHNPKVFSILGTTDGVRSLAASLTGFGMGEALIYVGERLSYPTEKIFSARAKDLTAYEGDPLSVICVLNEEAQPLPATHGLPDEAFLRGKAPMTKEEVRAVSLAKLALSRDSICYDIGAGTGSVSVEMALRADQGTVYAIEKKADALEVLEQNRQKFCLDHMKIVAGEAPDALQDLPAPTHAFIGGSSGTLVQLVDLLLQKNPQVRIVINCITLETAAEALQALARHPFSQREIVTVTAARSREIGRYHMMMGENPITIITCQNILP